MQLSLKEDDASPGLHSYTESGFQRMLSIHWGLSPNPGIIHGRFWSRPGCCLAIILGANAWNRYIESYATTNKGNVSSGVTFDPSLRRVFSDVGSRAAKATASNKGQDPLHVLHVLRFHVHVGDCTALLHHFLRNCRPSCNMVLAPCPDCLPLPLPSLADDLPAYMRAQRGPQKGIGLC